ncbi:efflux transporter outer membrane subunit [Paracoccus aminophilus]|uniref:RND efflux system, outer membrane lipoprotein n=1 Tax=Paracoccus aminophilus JCM 7686 TaxID=1367847 RepID=S5YZS6_PARAH|nr:efflux transporter outer membrane subunit [Paracoccus aminophilus]AGT10716.1 RND efflux system, outer membrane lipoprotein [Paracoccus aminophilus JCM 7686]
MTFSLPCAWRGRRARLLTSLPMLLVLAACATTEFTPPKADLAPKFDGAAPARKATGPWWQSFRDRSLDGLIAQGLARNLSIEEAVAVIDEAQAGVGLARAADLPQVQAGASASRGDQQGTGIRETSSGTLSTSWMIDIFGGNRANRAAAIAELEAAKLSKEAAEQAVTASIALAYIDLRYYQQSLALTRQSITSRRETLKMTRAMDELGQATRLDVLQAEQAVAQAEADLPRLEMGADQALNKLATLTASRTAVLRPALQKSTNQPNAQFKPSVGLPAEVIRARPDVAIAERQYAAAVARVGVAEAAFWPSVSLSGSITPTNIRRGGSLTSWALGPQINLPIFEGGANKARLSAAESRAVQAQTRWKATVLKGIEEVENGLSAYNRGSSNVAAQRKLVNTAQETVSLSREAWTGGQSDFFTVLDAERNVLTARSALAAAQRDHAAGYVALSIAAAAPIR